MRAPIHSTKHYIQMTLTSVTTGTENEEVLVDSVEVVDKNVNQEVEEGAIVKAIYIELWAIGSTADQFFTIILHKLMSGLAFATFANITDLGGYANKKNILYTTQGLSSNDGISSPVPLIRQWFKVPKGKQRFGLGDRLCLQVASRGDATVKYCGFATYKEYT